MLNLGLTSEPNQSFTVQLDGSRYDFTIKETHGVMSVTIARDNVILVENIRMVGGTPLLPYVYQMEGNFFLVTDNDEYPDYRLFNTTQSLVYLTVAEIDALQDELIISAQIFKPSLSFNFLNVPSLISTEGFTATITRASVASYYDPTGLLIKAANNIARFDNDPTTLAPRGLLQEIPGTNLALRSESFDNATWTKTHSSVTANAAVAPDGTSTGDKLIEDNTNNQHIAVQSGSFTNGQTYTFSTFFKAGERLDAWMFLPVAAFSGNPYCFVNLFAGTLGTPNGCTANLQALPGGWYRMSITATATATTSGNYGVGTATGVILSSATYLGDNVSGLYVWGAQLENNAFMSSYIPTVASTALRAADLITVGTSGWLASGLGTLFAKGETFNSGIAAVRKIAELSDGTAANILSYSVDGTNSNKTTLSLLSSSVSQYSFVNATYGFTAPTAGAAAYQTNAINGAIDGVLDTPDTVAVIPTFTQLTLGAAASGNSGFNGWITEVNYYPTTLRPQIIKSLTE